MAAQIVSAAQDTLRKIPEHMRDGDRVGPLGMREMLEQ